MEVKNNIYDNPLKIDVKTIRLGNLVSFDNIKLLVKGIAPSKLFLGSYDNKFNEWIDIEKISYIPLNSFWFSKINFKEFDKDTHYERAFEYYDINGNLLVKHLAIQFDIDDCLWKAYEKIEGEPNYIKNVFGLHHLQNLVFELIEINL